MTFTALIAALIAVESGGNHHAVGDGGKAIGILQIHQVMVDEANRLSNERHAFTWPTSCFSYEQSTNIAGIYFRQWPKASAQTLSRRWNGGPRGDAKKATVQYWNKVNKAITKFGHHTCERSVGGSLRTGF